LDEDVIGWYQRTWEIKEEEEAEFVKRMDDKNERNGRRLT